MPELPEVETTRRGLLPFVQGRRIVGMTVRDRRLRWPVPAGLPRRVAGRRVDDIARRGKYLLWDVESQQGGGTLLVHLGMSGSLFRAPPGTPPATHDHVEWRFDDGAVVRLHDPRRFGAVLWIGGRTPAHPLLDALGPEPLGPDFDGAHLYAASRGRSVSVKEFIMNGRIVVGVGNIYASEALFAARIRPTLPAGRIAAARYADLAQAIRRTLTRAIRAGGTSLRDYVNAEGELGYFQVRTQVYGRAGQPCRVCATPVREMRQGQRATYYCAHCQR